MNATPVEPRRWSAGRLATGIAFVLMLQVVLLFWPPPRSPASTGRRMPPSVIRLDGNQSDEFLALDDPTLFALPHRQNFSGAAWLQVPRQEFQPSEWTEAPRWLPLAAQELGS